MSKTKLTCLFFLAVYLPIVVFFPESLLAETTDFGSKEIGEQANKIQSFLFGTPLRMAGIMGGAYGVFQSVVSSSIRPLVAYGGIGLAVNVLPTFINGVFSVSGALLP